MTISLYHKRLDFAFALCLALTVVMPTLWPGLRLSYFAPFLVIACYQKPLTSCLWLAILCGVILDLLSSYTHLGMTSLNYCLTLLIVYPQRRNFFADNLSTLPIMTTLFAVISTWIAGFLLYSLEMQNIFSWHWIFSDVIGMSFADSFYAFLCFIVPAQFSFSRKRPSR